MPDQSSDPFMGDLELFLEDDDVVPAPQTGAAASHSGPTDAPVRPPAAMAYSPPTAEAPSYSPAVPEPVATPSHSSSAAPAGSGQSGGPSGSSGSIASLQGAAIDNVSSRAADAMFAGATSRIQDTMADETKNCCSPKFYRFLFDIDTDEFFKRMLKGLVPKPSRFFEDLAAKPDLYGPFWITVTLIMIVAFSGNIKAYWSYVDSGSTGKFAFQFEEMTTSTSVFAAYMLLMPLFMWITAKAVLTAPCKLLPIYCLYGYCLTPYLIAVMADIMNNDLIKWVFAIVGGSWSTITLCVHLFDVFRYDGTAAKISLIVFGALHLTLCVVVKLVFL